ncbi:hypothetical protein EJ04DRAFT_581914 [Polyplosphaeria fusca]|uniref:Uncharacterized protein n=1 Tax=Polyplosphaeria fusca TaxID=682080 RepID=A0A9P4QJG5_9PLEO|nr:hypothetical protein EJ04DRAFT_581914 [Polyplosphaeria fusca]
MIVPTAALLLTLPALITATPVDKRDVIMLIETGGQIENPGEASAGPKQPKLYYNLLGCPKDCNDSKNAEMQFRSNVPWPAACTKCDCGYVCTT